jgi:polysaccharide biosynthesis protein PelD
MSDFLKKEWLEKWLETVLIAALILAGGYFFNREDPLFMRSEFQWIWLAPVLIALRYGLLSGMVSVAIIFMSCLIMRKVGVIKGEFPTEFMLGGVLITLICGQFSTIWTTRLRRSDSLSRHASERFEQLSRAYFMVRLSHDRLEQNLISRPVTLRDAMFDMRSLLASHGGELNKETCASLISILVQYCSLESAAIHLVGADGRLSERPVAECGLGAEFKADDILLRSVIESGSTSYQSANRLERDESSPYLVVAPLRTSSGVLRGVLLISEMPFMSLQREPLQIMGVLLAYATDHAEAAAQGRKLLAVFPDCPVTFASELGKMVRLRRDLDVSTSLVVINVNPTKNMNEICVAIERQQRGLDHAWRRELGWGVQFVTLMPFSGQAAIEGYTTRLNSMLRREFGMRIGEEGLSSRSFALTAEEPLVQLAELLVEES